MILFICLKKQFSLTFKDIQGSVFFVLQSDNSFFSGIPGALDVVYAVDVSNNVDDNLLDRMKAYMKKHIQAYKINSSGARIGILTFGGEPVVTLPLWAGFNLTGVINGINNIKPTGADRPRDYISALDKLASNMFVTSGGIRADTPKVLVVLTTGKNSGIVNREELKLKAKLLHDKGVEVIVLAIGKDVDSGEITNIVTDPIRIIITYPGVIDNSLANLELAIGSVLGMTFIFIFLGHLPLPLLLPSASCTFNLG